MRKYAYQWWGGFNLSPLILYPLRALIAVSEDDTCDLAKPLNEKTNVSFFFCSFPFFDIYRCLWAAKILGWRPPPLPPPPPRVPTPMWLQVMRTSLHVVVCNLLQKYRQETEKTQIWLSAVPSPYPRKDAYKAKNETMSLEVRIRKPVLKCKHIYFRLYCSLSGINSLLTVWDEKLVFTKNKI